LIHFFLPLLIPVSLAEHVEDDWDTVFAGVDRTATAHARFTITIPKLSSVFTGSGDLTAALLLAHSHEHPKSLVSACEKSIATVQAVCKRTIAHYHDSLAALEAAKSAPEGSGNKWIIDAAASSSGQMGAIIPAFNELRLIQSKADIEAPLVPTELKATAAK
jgi:hypothetical protein